MLSTLPIPPNPAIDATRTPNGSAGPVAANASSTGRLPAATNPQPATRRAESVARDWPRSRRASNHAKRPPPTPPTRSPRTATATSSRAPNMEAGTRSVASPSASDPVASVARATPHVMAMPTRPRKRRLLFTVRIWCEGTTGPQQRSHEDVRAAGGRHHANQRWRECSSTLDAEHHRRLSTPPQNLARERRSHHRRAAPRRESSRTVVTAADRSAVPVQASKAAVNRRQRALLVRARRGCVNRSSGSPVSVVAGSMLVSASRPSAARIVTPRAPSCHGARSRRQRGRYSAKK